VSSGRDLLDPFPDTDAVQMSDKLAEIVSCMPSDLFQQFQCLPDRPPSASNDPEAALALHRLLATLDPSLASRWHWRDTRKVLRNLYIIKETGKQASEILKEQSQIDMNPKWVLP
jgi:tRNA dimethylallyltransferase